MDNKFLSYFTADKASDKQSLYDHSHHNLYSATFGGLTCTFWDKVLAKDYYKIAASTQSKGAALSSPTFTELKSNDYAFFVPNQTIWKHWNDYFTNGTEFAETYGSNRNNQDLQGIFKEPQIPVNYLQLIGKIAKGYAVPAYRVELRQFLAGRTYYAPELDEMFFEAPDDVTISAPDIIRILLYYHPELLPFFKGVTVDPYVQIESGSGIFNEQSPFWRSSLSVVNTYLTDHPVYIYLYGSPQDVRHCLSAFGVDDYVSPVNFDDKTFSQSTNAVRQMFTLFADRNSSRPRFSDSPFLIQNVEVPAVINGYQGSLTSVRYLKRVNQTDHRTFDRLLVMQDYSNFRVEAFGVTYDTIRDTSFFYKTQVQFEKLLFNSTTIDKPGIIFGTQQNLLIYNEWLRNEPQNPFAHDDYPVDNFSFTYTSILFPRIFEPEQHNNSLPVSPFDPVQPVGFFSNSDLKDYYYPSEPNQLFSSEVNYVHGDNVRPESLFELYHFVYQTDGYQGFHPLLYDPQANVLGYTQYGFFIYLYQNVCKHLDYTGLPIDTFIPRDFKEFARETISAFPYFAYSKIWDEYFRNKTVSSPELDFSETNGNIFQSRCYVQYYNEFPTPASQEERLEGFNSWVIPFSCTPKSGISQELFQFGSESIFANFKNELHYYNVNNTTSMLALLTGYQLTNHILYQLSEPYVNDNNSIYVTGFIYDHFVLPNYYNGLLHYKYQNFTKDYFSSALLDPMSGANQELVPGTVTELRTAQAKQSFWERTAVARSIKKFYEMMVGTTPTHIEYDKPLLLGADHQNVQVSEVIQTSETNDTPLGTRAGIIADFGKGGLCSHFFNEPGIIMVLHSITVDAQYMQGLLKKFTPYQSYLDYPFTQFAHIGNESIFMRELNYTPNAEGTLNLSLISSYRSYGLKDEFGEYGIPRSSVVNNPLYVTMNGAIPQTHPNMVELTDDTLDAVFGYIPRYSYLKFCFDEVHGDFRESMDFWHTFREFHYMPYLSHEFVNYEAALRDSNLERIFAVLEDGDKFWQSTHFYITVKRSVPYYTVPKSSVN